MSQGDTGGPALSVVLVAPSGTATIRRVMRHLRAQTARREMEVLIVAPGASDVDLPEVAGDAFAVTRVVEAGPITHRGAAAALGMRQAAAPLVGLIEDHSFPEPGWAEALIRALDGPWAGVGPAVRNGNPETALSVVNFLLAYGGFDEGRAAAECGLIPWHNSTYRRAAIAQCGERLGDLLEWEAALQEEIVAAGGRLYFEPAAITSHVNVSLPASTFGLNFQRGRIMAGRRAAAARQRVFERALRAAAFPAYPFMQLRGLWPSIRRSSASGRGALRLAPALSLALLAMALGEAAGYLFGVGRAIEQLEDYELHRARHLTARDRPLQLEPRREGDIPARHAEGSAL
ncbi:MAG: hypothetical protein HOP28_04520 [Gemmatimonadales bacterium]|nr:hypothetical protein [Gemmatimonadales bacterium]